MGKYLCWAALGISGLMLLLFLSDLIIKTPFGMIDWIVDILGVLASGLVGYLSWEAYRDQR
jgi:hypothetical protein